VETAQNPRNSKLLQLAKPQARQAAQAAGQHSAQPRPALRTPC
jgi:hypothetical protein